MKNNEVTRENAKSQFRVESSLPAVKVSRRDIGPVRETLPVVPGVTGAMIALEDEETREGFDDVLQAFIKLSLNILV